MDEDDDMMPTQKRRYTQRGATATARGKRKTKGSTGISGKCRSDGSMIVKGNWTDAEDERLSDMVNYFLGVKQDPKGIASTRWSEIAKELPGRVGKQCRERWHNHLRPDINKGRWTFVEEVTIYMCWRNWNSQWARISRILDGRSDNRVKNHWNCHMKRRLARDQTYFSFMEECYTYLNRAVNFKCEDDFEDVTFRNMLMPKIEKYLAEHRQELDRLPLFATSKRDTPKQSSSHQSSSLTNMESLLQITPREAKRPAKSSKGPKSKRQCQTPTLSSAEEGDVPQPPRRTLNWLTDSPDPLRDMNEENNYMSHGLNFSTLSPPTNFLSHFALLSQESYVEDDKAEMNVLLGSGIAASPNSGFICTMLPQNNNGFRSPIPACAMEVVVAENGLMHPTNDIMWSGAVNADFAVGSPVYSRASGGQQSALTSTPLKQSSFNVPSASECGASSSLLSPYRHFLGFHSAEDAFLSPIRRSFCGETSAVDDTWSPSKLSQGIWSPIKLGSIANIIKTPQAIRDAFASSEANRSRISPEDLVSPSRLFNDASELIDDDRMGKESLVTPEIVKCRRRLTDQWTNNMATPSSFCSSGYASFHGTPGGSLGQ